VAFREYYIVIVKFESVTYLYVKRWFQVQGQCNSAPVMYIGPMSAQCRTPSSCHSNDNVTLAQCWEVLAGSATETSLAVLCCNSIVPCLIEYNEEILFSSFLSAESLVNSFIALCQPCLKLRNTPTSRGCSQ